jgi:hypothetical protein
MVTMMVVADAGPGEATVLNTVDSGPCLRGSGTSISWCGNCGAILLDGVDPQRVVDVIFRCECGAYNRPVV